MKAATAPTPLIRARARATSTTPRRTRTGTTRCALSVTIYFYAARLLRRSSQTLKMVSLSNLLRQTHYWVWIAGSTKFGKPRQQISMGKKHKNLFQQIVSPDNIRLAYYKAAKGKTYSRGHLVFREHLATNLELVRSALINESYVPGSPNIFLVHEPKCRKIACLPFIDRVAEHAINNVIEPIFEKTFLPQSYACRKNKGTHRAAKDVQATLRKMQSKSDSVWFLKTDFSRYFASVHKPILAREVRNKISCPPTLRLIDRVVLDAPGGLEIGRLSSQLLANLYGHVVDRWLVHERGFKTFFRYMDDIVFLAYSREALSLLRLMLESFALYILRLSLSHWYIQPASRGINFVGYRIWHSHKLLRRDSVLRAKRKLAALDPHDLALFIPSWQGHARHANTHNLMKRMALA